MQQCMYISGTQEKEEGQRRRTRTIHRKRRTAFRVLAVYHSRTIAWTCVKLSIQTKWTSLYFYLFLEFFRYKYQHVPSNSFRISSTYIAYPAEEELWVFVNIYACAVMYINMYACEHSLLHPLRLVPLYHCFTCTLFCHHALLHNEWRRHSEVRRYWGEEQDYHDSELTMHVFSALKFCVYVCVYVVIIWPSFINH
jgi:hypothetical protein